MGLNRNLGQLTEVITEQNGNIGIGVLSVGYKTQIESNGADVFLTKNTSATSFNRSFFYNNSNFGIQIQSYGSSYPFGTLWPGGANSVDITSNAPNGLSIGTSTSSSFVLGTNSIERARITSSGSLLVGGTSDTAGGVIQAIGTTGTRLSIRSTSSGGTQPGLNFFHDGNDVFSITGGSGLRFLSSGVNERMRIGFNGNVLIGTTTDLGYKFFTDGFIGTSLGYGSSRRLTITALNTNFTLADFAFSGLVVIRDNTNGGSAAWLVDPNMGSIQIANNMPGTWNIFYNFGNGTTVIQKTSGSVSILLGIALYGNG
jgi:hypothetical protein